MSHWPSCVICIICINSSIVYSDLHTWYINKLCWPLCRDPVLYVCNLCHVLVDVDGECWFHWRRIICSLCKATNWWRGGTWWKCLVITEEVSFIVIDIFLVAGWICVLDVCCYKTQETGVDSGIPSGVLKNCALFIFLVRFYPPPKKFKFAFGCRQKTAFSPAVANECTDWVKFGRAQQTRGHKCQIWP